MKARRVKKLDPSEPLAENAARIVHVRLDEMRSFAPTALKPKSMRDQHDMRIAAKRLRYVLEVTESCFGRPAEVARRRARDLQDLLGEIHDCDVMLPRVEAHLAKLQEADATAVLDRAGDATDLEPALAARAPHRTAYRGLETLTVYLQARRRLLFSRFATFWSDQEQAGTWDRLDRAMTRRIEQGRRRRRAAKRARRASEELEEARRAESEAASRAEGAAAELQAAELQNERRAASDGVDGQNAAPRRSTAPRGEAP